MSTHLTRLKSLRELENVAGLVFILCVCVIGGFRYFVPATHSQTTGQQMAGDVVGNFSTDYQGSAIYQVPILVPPGTNGQQPNLMLVYNSQVKNGIAGMGWSLYGISSISTCNHLINPNGSAGVTKDPFCLDGVRLVQVAPRQYQTEKQSWLRIVTKGGTDDAPETFVITDRNGTTTEFGASENSRIYNKGANSIRMWMVGKVTDRNSNYAEFTYDNRSKTAGEFYPQFIEYTGNAQAMPPLLPQRRLEFVYENRPDPLRNYRDGSEIVIAKRLQGIRTSITENGASRVVRFYKCTYDIATSTNRSRITSITILDAAGNNLIPTSLIWQGGQNAVNAATELARFGDTGVVYTWADFNGDGKADLLVDQTVTPYNHWVLLSQGTRLGSPITLTRFGSQYSSYTWDDLNGDGLADLLIDDKQPGQSDNLHYAFLSRGNSVGPRIDLRRFGTSDCAFHWTDFNGDGRADLACDENSGQFRHWVLKSNGTNLDSPIYLGVLGANVGGSAWVDFNGDGLDDLVFDQTAQPFLHWVRLSDGSALGSSIALGAFGSDPAQFTWADFNGDGLPDLLFDQIKSASNYFGHQVRFSTATNLSSAIQLPNFGQQNATYRWLDFNDDGMADLLVDQMNGASSGHWVSLSSGTSMVTPAISLGAFGATNVTFSWADVNGDGLPDLTFQQNSDLFLQQARLHSGNYPDLLTQINNGIGGQTRITYKPLTDNSIYTKATGENQAQYPLRDIQNSLYVVAEHSTNDGRENPKTYFFDYAYAGAVTDLTGRGWLGFRTITARDRQTGVRTATTYAQPFPLTGLITSTIVANSDARTLNERNLKFRVSESTNPLVLEVLKTAEALTYYSGKGPNLSYTIGQEYTYDSYGNVILQKDQGDSSTTTDDLYMCTQYLNDLDNWVLGLPLLSIKTNLATIGGSGACMPDRVLSKDRFTYSNDSILNVETSESWNDTDDSWLVTSYSYDVYGNRVSVNDPATGRIVTTYDPAYQSFPIETTNALGQTVRQRFDAAFGIPIEYTSENGNHFSTTLDGFGRLTANYGPAANDPQGSPIVLSTVSRQLATTSATAKLFVHTNQRTSWAQADQSKWLWRNDYQDGLNRTWRVESGRFDQARTINQDYKFDDEARTTQEAQPYYDKDQVFSTILTYDDQGRVNSVTTPNNAKNVNDYSIVTDASGVNINRNTTTVAPGTDNEASTISYVNARGKVTKRIYPKNPEDQTAAEVNYQYDLLQRLIRIEKPNNVVTEVRYDSLNHQVSVTDTNSGTTTYVYWPSGLLKMQTNSDGRTISYAYDSIGRISSQTTAEASTVFTYDNAQNNPQITNPVGNLTKVVTSSGGVVQSVYEYSYDAYGRVNRTWLTLDGETFTQSTEYDAAGRPYRATYPDGSVFETRSTPEGFMESVGLVENVGTPNETYTSYATFQDYTAIGKYKKAVYKNGVVSEYDYYPYGYVKTSKTTLPASPTQPLLNFEYTWNNVNTITTIKDNVVPANTQTFTYNKQGYLTSARSDGLYGSLSFGYDLAGNVTRKDEIHYVANGQQVVRGTKDGPTVFTASYNTVGDLATKIDENGTWTNTFGPQGVLLTVTRNGARVYNFVYDYRGRRLIKQDVANGVKTLYVSAFYEVTKFSDGSRRNTKYIAGPTGRIASITTQQGASPPTPTPGNGVLLTRTSVGIGVLLLLALSLVLLRVGPRRRKINRELNWGRALAFWLVATLLVHSVVLSPPTGVRVSAQAKKATSATDNVKGVPSVGTYFFTQDQINSTTLVTDEQGAKSARVYYKPFGEIYMLEGTDGFRAKFTGQELDQESGLYYYNTRYYDPRLGRFISPDTFTLGGPDISAASLNQYAYTGNNPVIYTDPSGQIFGIDDAIVIAIVTAVSVAAGTYFGGAAVNHNLNPAKWDWTAPKTYVGMIVGAAIGFAGAEIGVGVAGAIGGVAGNIIGGALAGAFENAAYSALGGGSPEQIAEQALTGAVLGAAFAGAAAGVSRGLSRFGRAAGEGLGEETGAVARQTESLGAKPVVEEPPLTPSRCMCFQAGTEVATENGSVKIEDVKLGDAVVAYDDATGEVTPRRVIALFERMAHVQTTVVAGGQVINTTPEHRFWVQGFGWVNAAALQSGDMLISEYGEEIEVGSVESHRATSVVYNLEVEGAHTYFVSPRAILVHNPCDEVEWDVYRAYKEAREAWENQTITLYRGTRSAESSSILNQQVLTSKAQLKGVAPTFWNRSLFARMWHSITSDNPPSQFVSLTADPNIAKNFAQPYAHAFEVRRRDVKWSWWNWNSKWIYYAEKEYLAPGGTKISNPRVINDKQ